MILLGIDLFAVGCAGRESQKNRFVRRVVVLAITRAWGGEPRKLSSSYDIITNCFLRS